MSIKKIILIMITLFFVLFPITVQAQSLDIEEVTEIRICSMNGYYRDSPQGKTTEYCKKGDIIYVISELKIPTRQGYSIIYLKCNTENGIRYLWDGFSEYKENLKELADKEDLSLEYINSFKVTTYCSDSCCNGKWAGSPAKNGEPLKVGYTIAVDPNVIPLNSWVYIEDIGLRKACDTGSAIKGNKIDLLIEDCSEQITYYNKKVWLVK